MGLAYEEMRVFRESIRVRQEEIGARIEAADEAVRIEIGKLIDADPAELHLGKWECTESPTGRCWYDDEEDVNHDYCLICGDPSERK